MLEIFSVEMTVIQLVHGHETNINSVQIRLKLCEINTLIGVTELLQHNATL